MTPAERAAALIRVDGGNFVDELEAHLLNGCVFSTTRAFLMARPVPRRADVLDAWQTWPTEQCDAWYVWMGVGRIEELLALMPYPLPWLGWTRIGRRRAETLWVLTARLRRRASARVERLHKSTAQWPR